MDEINCNDETDIWQQYLSVYGDSTYQFFLGKNYNESCQSLTSNIDVNKYMFIGLKNLH